VPVSSLPADQIAVLELVLERGRTYDEIADLLGIDAHSVRARAHAAVDALGPNGSGRRLTTARRAELADFLLGQQDDEASEATRTHLAGSSGSRAWARVVAGELKPLGGDKLPEIPTEGKTKSSGATTKVAKAPKPPRKPAPAKRAPVEAEDEPGDEAEDEDVRASTATGRPSLASAAPSSRLGGALLIGGIALIVIVLFAGFVWPKVFGGGDDKKDSAKVTKTSSTPTTPAAAPQVIGQINLKGSGKAVGIAQIVQQGNTQALIIAGQNLPADKNTAYAVWLYNSAKDAKRLGYAQPSATQGRVEAIAPLPADATKFKDLVISAESRATATQGKGPTTPTKIVLQGALASATAPTTGTGTPTTPGATTTPGTTTPGTTTP
jgi:hypothetical protein